MAYPETPSAPRPWPLQAWSAGARPDLRGHPGSVHPPERPSFLHPRHSPVAEWTQVSPKLLVLAPLCRFLLRSVRRKYSRMAWGDGSPREECAGRRGRATPHEHAEQAKQRYWQAAARIPVPLSTRESRYLIGRLNIHQKQKRSQSGRLEYLRSLLPDPLSALLQSQKEKQHLSNEY